jgi:hypothetical protein
VEAWRRGYRQVEIARFLGVHYTTVAKMIGTREADREFCTEARPDPDPPRGVRSRKN